MFPYPGSPCIHELVEAQTERTPSALAAIHGSQSLSYTDLNARANQLARFLLQLGLKPETPVGIALRSSLNLPIALLGTLKAGGVCVPLDPNYPKERLRLMLQDSRPAAILTEARQASELAFADTQLIALDSQEPSIFRGPTSNLPNLVHSEALAYIIYTSGSTGKPRGVLLTHRGLANHHQAAVGLYDLSASDRILQFSSISFDIAIEEIFPSLSCGATIVLKTDSFSLQAREFLPWLEQYQVTVLDLPTAYWHELVHQLAAFDTATLPGSLRLVILGGEKASTKTYRLWQKLTHKRVRLINTYGPTEASVIVSAFEPARFPHFELGDSLPLGRAVANAELHLLDENLTPVTAGAAGELYIGGPPLARGYLNQPKITAERFIPNPFHKDPLARLYKTGDMARYAKDGNLEFLGRVDFQVKIRGYRVEPGEIEAVLNRHPGIAESVVVGCEDESGDKRLAAYLVWSPAAERMSDSGMQNYLRQQLPEYMIPNVFVSLEHLPLTENGKLNRAALPKPQFISRPTDSCIAPEDELQAQLVRIWQAVLRKDQIGTRDNFFDLGGHSLLAARLMHAIGRAFGQTLPLALLFQAPTIDELSSVLRQKGWSQHWSCLVAIQPFGSKLPFFCVHGVGGNVLNLRHLGTYLRPTYPLYGLQAKGLDGRQTCLSSVEEMATHYIAELQTVQPKGPYFLGGYSLGGVIAYEMAQQLSVRGQEVALVALLDSYPTSTKPVGQSLWSLLRTPQRLFRDLPYAAVDSLRRRIQRGPVAAELKRVFQNNAAAAERYVLKPYSGKVVLFRASEKSWRNSIDAYALWAQLAANLEVHEIPGDHRGILYEPRVRHLAEGLKARIDKMCSDYELLRLSRSAASNSAEGGNSLAPIAS